MATVLLRKSLLFPFLTSSGKALGTREITSNATPLPYFKFVFSTRLPGILTTESAYFAGSVVFRLLCPPLSLSRLLCVGIGCT